jgi:hypothetical protein
MKVTRTSLISGKVHTMELPVSPLDIDAYHAGTANIQDVFPHLTPEQREFIKSGITPEEWAKHVADNEEAYSEKRVSRKEQKLLALQVGEHIEPYHPELSGAAVDISPCGTFASAREGQKPKDK